MIQTDLFSVVADQEVVMLGSYPCIRFRVRAMISMMQPYVVSCVVGVAVAWRVHVEFANEVRSGSGSRMWWFVCQDGCKLFNN